MGALSIYAQRLADVARNELAEYGSLRENDVKLLKRIFFYCDTLGVTRPAKIADYAWSAVFVSWCVKEAGASTNEFKFSERHAIFVHWAIANAKARTGLFRAYPIDRRAPEIGDLIQNNRSHGKITYDQAAVKKSYDSHTAIVVGFRKKGAKNYAVTIGGNEHNSVGEREVELDASGLIVQRDEDSYICVVQNLKKHITPAVLALTGRTTRLAAITIEGVAAIASPALPESFRKHGAFFYGAADTIADYGSVELVAAAMTRAGMSHAWVRIHGQAAYGSASRKATSDLIAGLKAAGIAVAGWGWCQGEDPAADAKLAMKELTAYGLSDYIADIEHGHHNADWSIAEIVDLCKRVRVACPGGFGISTFPLIDYHEPQLMQAALPYVDMFNPQVYWFHFPDSKMIKRFKRPNGKPYRVNDAAEYAELCLDRWDRLMGATPKPIVMTGQAYWGESHFTEGEANEKVEQFLGAWDRFNRIVGFNWWHFGGGNAMSHRMLEAVSAASLGTKPYRR